MGVWNETPTPHETVIHYKCLVELRDTEIFRLFAPIKLAGLDRGLMVIVNTTFVDFLDQTKVGIA